MFHRMCVSVEMTVDEREQQRGYLCTIPEKEFSEARAAFAARDYCGKPNESMLPFTVVA
jgi:hypothetical protein